MVKTEVPGICRTNNGALINTNNFELINYRLKKEEKKTIIMLKSEIAALKETNAAILVRLEAIETAFQQKSNY